jgi:hypothetical protein
MRMPIARSAEPDLMSPAAHVTPSYLNVDHAVYTCNPIVPREWWFSFLVDRQFRDKHPFIVIVHHIPRLLPLDDTS